MILFANDLKLKAFVRLSFPETSKKKNKSLVWMLLSASIVLSSFFSSDVFLFFPLIVFITRNFSFSCLLFLNILRIYILNAVFYGEFDKCLLIFLFSFVFLIFCFIYSFNLPFITNLKTSQISILSIRHIWDKLYTYLGSCVSSKVESLVYS